MVLRYMVSDTDLTKGQLSQPKKSIALPKKRVRFLLLLVANVITLAIILAFVYKLWMPETIKASIWKVLPTNRKMLTGIMYNVETPRAIVCGEIVREGETIDGYKVVKIHRDKVVLEKNGEFLTLRAQ